MHHIRLRLAAGLLTFVVGTSLAYRAGRPADAPDCFRAAFDAGRPSPSLLRPLETTEMLWTAPRLD